MHSETHPRAGQTVKLNVASSLTAEKLTAELAGQEFVIEDWWDHLTGGSWMDAVGNPAALKYALRSGALFLPLDNEVVYGHVGPFGHLVHASELGEVVPSHA